MDDKGGTFFMHLTGLQTWNFFHIFFRPGRPKLKSSCFLWLPLTPEDHLSVFLWFI